VTLTWNVADSDTAAAEEVDLDLYVKTAGGYQQTLYFDEWTKEGTPEFGDWNVQAPENTSVTQNTNGGPTFLISPIDFLNVEIQGTWVPPCGGDDDFIGMVFGLEKPVSGNGDAVDLYKTFVYGWKGRDQWGATEGHYLAYVDGTVPTCSGSNCWHSDGEPVREQFWEQNENSVYNLVAQNTGAGKGWYNAGICGTNLPFKLIYSYNQIIIEVNGDQIFSVVPGDVGMSTFERGRFGFYNYSQDNVTYKDFTVGPAPGAPTDLNLFRPDVCSVHRPVTDTCENVVNNDGVLNSGLGGACENPTNPGVAVTVPSTTIAGICPAGEASTTGTCSGSSTTLVNCTGLSPCPAGCNQIQLVAPDRVLAGGAIVSRPTACFGSYTVVEDCAYTTEMGCSAVAACAWDESGVCNAGLVMCSAQTKDNCEALQTVGLCQWNSDDLKNDPPFVEHSIITTNTSASYEAWVVVEEGATGVSEPLPFRLRFRIPNQGDEIRTHEIFGEVNPGVLSQSISVTWEGDIMTTGGWNKVYTDSGTTP
jgi:hypothetical protein